MSRRKARPRSAIFRRVLSGAPVRRGRRCSGGCPQPLPQEWHRRLACVRGCVAAAPHGTPSLGSASPRAPYPPPAVCSGGCPQPLRGRGMVSRQAAKITKKRGRGRDGESARAPVRQSTVRLCFRTSILRLFAARSLWALPSCNVSNLTYSRDARRLLNRSPFGLRREALAASCSGLALSKRRVATRVETCAAS